MFSLQSTSLLALILAASSSLGCSSDGTPNGVPASGGNPGTGGTGGDATDTGGSNGVGGSNTGGSTGSGGGPDGSGGSAPGTVPTPRTACPTAPPATEKAAAADRSLAVSKTDYAQLLTQETPFQGTRGDLPWHLYTPEQVAQDASALFPLIVVLHGGYGREVTDGNIMVDVAQYLLGSQNGLLTESNRSAYPSYIVFPHCREAEGCSFGTNEWGAEGGADFEVKSEPSVAGGTAIELIEHVIATYNVDPTRVYLTGNSMGGGGTWDFISRRPELFAAALPVSGHTPAPQFLTPITEAKLPVWAFGGNNDFTNPYTDTVDAISAINTAGGCAWLTTYTGTGHDDGLWSSPYLEPEIWPWLFAQTNSSAPRPALP